MRAHASRDGVRVRAKAAVEDNGDGDGEQGVAEPAKKEGCTEQTRRPPHPRGAAASAAWRPGNQKKIVGDGGRVPVTADGDAGLDLGAAGQQ